MFLEYLIRNKIIWLYFFDNYYIKVRKEKYGSNPSKYPVNFSITKVWPRVKKQVNNISSNLHFKVPLITIIQTWAKSMDYVWYIFSKLWKNTKYLLQAMLHTVWVIYFIQDWNLNFVHLKYCVVFSFEIDCSSLFYWYISDIHTYQPVCAQTLWKLQKRVMKIVNKSWSLKKELQEWNITYMYRT